VITERHYDDAALIYLMESGLPDDPHVAACHQCSESLAAYRAIREVLGQEAVWDLQELNDEPVPQTIATLGAFATGMAREDADADAILARLLAGPRESWLPRLAQHPEWRTAGVVRRLIAALDHALDTMPPDAVEITALATDIADHLPLGLYPSETVLKLRGAAWRERAYALDYTGDYAAALRAVLRAEDNLVTVQVADYDRARLHLVAAKVLRNLDQPTEATQRTRTAAVTFAVAGDRRRHNLSRTIEGLIAYRLRDVRSALSIFVRLETACQNDDHERAILLQNIAHCHRELSDFAAAAENFTRAVAIFERLNVPTEALRAQWGAAKMALAGGSVREAAGQFAMLRADFDKKGMAGEMILVSLDLAESLLLLHREAAATAICREVVHALDAHGLSHLQTASTAIALLKEASAAMTVTATVVADARQWLRKAPREGHRLFASAPEF
jgi:tetratricopeptide (TPR) repeat protein